MWLKHPRNDFEHPAKRDTIQKEVIIAYSRFPVKTLKLFLLHGFLYRRQRNEQDV